MHHCLLVPELVRLFCNEVNKIDRRTLPALALTCRSFHEPSLDNIWHTLGGVGPLIKCMPEDLWAVESVNLREEFLTFRRPIIPTDWPRFVANAKRVRILKFELSSRSFNRPTLNYNAYQTLGSSNHPSPLLPNLRSLDWFQEDDKIFPFIKLFFGPKLQKFTILLDGSPLIGLSLLNTLCFLHPAMTWLEVLVNRPNSMVMTNSIQMVSISLQGLKYLRHLSLPEITPEAFIQLATLPYLQYLHLTVKGENLPLGFSSLQAPRAFPSLQSLSLIARYLSFGTQLINAMKSNALECISIYLLKASSSSFLGDFLAALRDNCSRDKLKDVSITYKKTSNEIIDPSSFANIEPLFGFSELTDLDLSEASPFIVNDQIIKALAQALPKITNLSFPTELSGDPSVTLQGLVPIARYCKNLNVLVVCVDAQHIPHKPDGDIYNTSLQMLTVPYSPLEDPREVAIFLSNIFPCLNEVLSYGETLDSWTEVEELLSLFLEIRASERERSKLMLDNTNKMEVD